MKRKTKRQLLRIKYFKYLVKLVIFDTFLLACLLLGLIHICKNTSIPVKASCNNKFVYASLNSGISRYLNYSDLYVVTGTTVKNKQTNSEILDIQYSNFIERRAIDVKSDLKIKFISEAYVYNNVIYPLAKIIYAEGGNQNDEFQQNVGYVVLNRVESKYYPDTIEGVFFAPEVYADTSIERYQNDEVSDRAIENATIVVKQYFSKQIPVSPARVYQAEFVQGVDIYQMGNTYFGSDPRILSDMKKQNLN